MKKCLLLLFLFVSFGLSAQKGILSGKVVDGTNAEPLIGAVVKVVDQQMGGEADLDGNYSIELDPGTYDLEVIFISYETKKYTGVEIKAGQTTLLDMTMGESAQTLETVVVVAKAERATENSLLVLQKKSPVVMDGISNQQFQRMGDGDAGAAVRRVTGVSVEGGRYVYVRGLGDRYSKTMLNASEIPGLDPNRNSVQLDMFPSNLIDNITVLKTFSADMPGDFTGGCVMINTKEFPERFTLSAGANFGYNTNATFNANYLGDASGGLDFLGIDNGDRALPSLAEGVIPEGNSNPQLIDQITRSFNRNYTPEQQSPFLNQSYNFSIGNRFNLGTKQLGLLFAITYSSENEFFENGINNRYILATAATGALSPTVLLDDSEGKNTVLIGAILNASLKLNENNKLSLNLMRNQSGISAARYMEGTNPFNTGTDVLLQSNVLRYIQRSLNFVQLRGEHYFEKAARLRMEWNTSFTYSQQDEPDFRTFTNSAVVDSLNEENVTYSITPANYKKPSRFFRDMEELTSDNKLHFTLPFAMMGQESRFKFGGSYLRKNRTFRERRLDYEGTETFVSTVGLLDLMADSHLGIVGTLPNGAPDLGIYIADATENRNQYDGTQTVGAGYVMSDFQFSPKVKLNIGLRAEYTNMEVISFSQNVLPGTIDQLDFLPGLNFVYEPVTDMNVRFSYSRTVARPNFREMAPFASFDFNQDNILVGNPNLNRVLSDNADVRWEYYLRPGEMIAVSGFYKRLQNPIERIFSPVASNEVTWRNVENGTVFGLEFDARKRLDFTPALANFTVGANLTLVRSQVDIDSAELGRFRAVLGPDYPDTRRLFAQSPYLINAFISYANAESGTEANLNFNIFGERLNIVGTGTAPDVYEQPRPMLNFMVSQQFGADKRFKVTVRGNNLLNPKYLFAYKVNDAETPFQSYRLGREFQLGVSYTVK